MIQKQVRQWIRTLLLLTVFMSIASPFTVHAEETDGKVVRVGWYDSSFCYWDEFGRRCGIDYEYQQKIAAYTGWTYEYVEDSWSNLFQMLIDGEIDLLCDVSYKPERAEYMLFPDLPMGAEAYYIYVAADEQEISAKDPESFNGKRIGVNKDSLQEGFLKDWAERNHIQIEIISLDLSEAESIDMLTKGELDGFTTIYSFGSEQKIVPVSRVGSSEYYYAVNKNRPDLLAELNMALSSINDDDPEFKQRIFDSNTYNTNTSIYLTSNQENWLKSHGTIRIGYLEDKLPFCQMDKETGELTGALKDYLAHAANNLRSYDIQFDAVPYTTAREAVDAMKAGEVDCVFPVNLSSYDASQMDVWVTGPAMKTEMNAVMRASDHQSISRDSAISFAFEADDINVETFIMAKYPVSSRIGCPDRKSCFEAVAAESADCILISSYRMPTVEQTVEKYKLFTVPTGETMPLMFAVNKKDRELYFIMDKTAAMTNSNDMDAALASYMHFNQKVSFTEFLKDNWIWVILTVTILFTIIIVLLLQKLNAERKANEQQKLMEEGLRRELEQKEQLQSAMEMAYKDPLTGVKSKRAFTEAKEQMNRRIADGQVKEFSVAVFDLNDLKQINDSRGHEVGDTYIREACRQICSCFKHSPVFRIGGDEFTAILEGEDYRNQDELFEKFEKNVLLNVEREKTVVAFGSSRFNPKKDVTFNAVIERADARMYKEKMLLKSMGAPEPEAESDQPNEQGFEDISAMKVRRHILIADDVDSNREILGELLQDDYDIIYASDGVETMEILQSRKDEIALLILDLYMPNMSGREVMMKMQVDEDLMSIPVIFVSIDLEAELDCLKIGAIDFIPKPYPEIDVIKARISKCIELAENRDLIRRTQRDKLTGLFNIDYFLRYVNRYDQYYKESSFDAVVCDVNYFSAVKNQYGRQFGDLVLRSIGIGINTLTRKIGGIGCRKEGDTFLLYVPHQEDYESLLRKFLEDLFLEKETAEKVTMRFGIYTDAQQEKDIEERFAKAKNVADNMEKDGTKLFRFYNAEE